MILTHKARRRIAQTMGKDAVEWCQDLVQYVFDHGDDYVRRPSNRLLHAREENVISKSLVIEYTGTREEWRGRYVRNDRGEWIVVDFYKAQQRPKRRRRQPSRAPDPLEHAHKGITVW